LAHSSHSSTIEEQKVLSNVRKIIFIALCVIIACIPGQAKEDDVWTLIPARSFGPLCIGQSFETVKNMFGDKPEQFKPVQNGYMVGYTSPGIIIQYHNFTQKIQFMGTNKKGYEDISYRTEEGITIGSPRSTVEKHYGAPNRVAQALTKEFYPTSNEIAYYMSEGIAFHYDMNNIVVVIIVFNPAIFGG